MKLVLDNGTEIPLENVKVVNVQEGDIICVEIDKLISMNVIEDIHEDFASVFNPIKVIILNKGIKLKKITKVEESEL